MFLSLISYKISNICITKYYLTLYVYLHMAEPVVVLDCLDQTGSRLAELEVVDSLTEVL